MTKTNKTTNKAPQRNLYRKFSTQISPIDQLFSNLSIHQNHLEDLVGF